MAATRHSSAWNQTVAAGTTTYVAWGAGVTGTTGTTESATQLAMRVAGTVSKLWCYLLSNSLNSTFTIRFRKNGANGNQVITFLTGVTGGAEDATNTDVVVVTDTVNVQVVTAAGSGSAQPMLVASDFAATTDTATVLMAGRAAGRAFNTNSINNFVSTSGGIDTGMAEVDTQVKVVAAGVFKALSLRVISNSRTSTTFKSRINGANGNQTMTVGNGATGLFQDTSNTDTVAVGDLVTTCLATDASGGTITVSIASYIFVSTASKSMYIGGADGAGSLAAGTSNFVGAFGPLVGGSPTEVSMSHRMDLAVTLSGFQANIGANAATGTSTYRPRINGANCNQVASVGAGVTGWIQDVTHTDVVSAASDTMCIQRNVGTGGAVAASTFVMLASYGTSASLFDAAVTMAITTTGDFATQITMAATPSMAITTAGAFTTQITMAGASTVSVTTAGNFTTQITMAASPSVVITTTGDLATAIRLAAASNIVVSTTGGLSTQILLAGASSIVITTTADIQAYVTFDATGAIVFSTTGDFATAIRLAGASSIVFTDSADLATAIQMAGAGQIVFQLSGDISNLNLFSGSAQIAFATTGDLLTQLLLAAAPQIDISTAASLSTQIALSGAGTITFAVSGVIITVVIDLFGISSITVQTSDGTITAHPVDSAAITAGPIDLRSLTAR